MVVAPKLCYQIVSLIEGSTLTFLDPPEVLIMVQVNLARGVESFRKVVIAHSSALGIYPLMAFRSNCLAASKLVTFSRWPQRKTLP
jgi:hypothetical protein